WSFSRHSAAPDAALDTFFKELASMLQIGLTETAAPLGQANAVLAAIAHKHVLLFLDGLEAAYSPSQQTAPSENAGQIPRALAHLVKGVARLRGSFIVATSQTDFSASLGLPEHLLHRITIEPTPVQPIQSALTQYADDLSRQTPSLDHDDGTG